MGVDGEFLRFQRSSRPGTARRLRHESAFADSACSFGGAQRLQVCISALFAKRGSLVAFFPRCHHAHARTPL